MDFSSDNIDEAYKSNIDSLSGEDIYQEDVDSETPYLDPESILIRDRKNTTQIEQTQTFVKNFVIKSSSNTNQKTANPIKKLVSKKKHRFSLDGFNLDLTCNNKQKLKDITDQIIAMGFPADDVEKYYRNSMEDVQKFFNKRHAGHYKIVNLYEINNEQRCAERKYKHSCFNNMVAEFPFEDHQAPTMDLIYSLCEDLDRWLNKDKKNIAAIHCKAGKGRTGVMICCYLLYNKMFSNSFDAMRYYGVMRTNNKKGVTIPSQIRYIVYFEKCLNNRWTLKDIPVVPLRINRIKLVTIPKMNYDGNCEPWFKILNNDKNHIQELEVGRKITQLDGCIDFDLDFIVKDDVRVIFFNKSVLDKKEKMFQFWFNTSFFDPSGTLIIDKFMLDGPVKDRAHKKFSANFRIEVEATALTHPTLQKYSEDFEKQPQKTISQQSVILQNMTTNQFMQAQTQVQESKMQNFQL